MLSYRYSNCEMALRKVWTDYFIRKDHIYSNDCILGVLCSLKKHAHVDVLNDIKLFLGGNDVIFIVFLFFFLLDLNGFSFCSSSSFGIRFSFRVWLCFGIFLFSCSLGLGRAVGAAFFWMIIREALFSRRSQLF